MNVKLLEDYIKEKYRSKAKVEMNNDKISVLLWDIPVSPNSDYVTMTKMFLPKEKIDILISEFRNKNIDLIINDR